MSRWCNARPKNVFDGKAAQFAVVQPIINFINYCRTRYCQSLAAQGDCMYRQMKLALAAGVLLGLGATGIASAADLPVKSSACRADHVQLAGLLTARQRRWRLAADGYDAGIDRRRRPLRRTTVANDTAAMGGAWAGCDFMAGKDLVFGIQGMFDFANVNGRHAVTDFPPSRRPTIFARSSAPRSGQDRLPLTP